MPGTKKLLTKPSALLGRQTGKVVLVAEGCWPDEVWVLLEGKPPPQPLLLSVSCLLRESVPRMGKGGSRASHSEASSSSGLDTSTEVGGTHPGQLGQLSPPPLCA